MNTVLAGMDTAVFMDSGLRGMTKHRKRARRLVADAPLGVLFG
jgi:hypothetical protein